MILHTDTALLKHRPAHLQYPSQPERAARRPTLWQCPP